MTPSNILDAQLSDSKAQLYAKGIRDRIFALRKSAADLKVSRPNVSKWILVVVLLSSVLSLEHGSLQYQFISTEKNEWMHWDWSIVSDLVSARQDHTAYKVASIENVTNKQTWWLRRLDKNTLEMMSLYCHGELMHTVQMANIFPDSKHFVDMPLRRNTTLSAIVQEFQQEKLSIHNFLEEYSYTNEKKKLIYQDSLRHFISKHFDQPGSDLNPVTPTDFREQISPPLIAKILEPEYREWAFELYKSWKYLGRIPEKGVQGSFLHAKGQKASQIIVVPGGRFRESYYWDSYWIVAGLMVSNMKQTAKGVVNNLLEYVDEFGFVPNGGRIYYLTRSQPPMLSDMVKIVALRDHRATGIMYDIEYLRYAVPLLDKEYSFWMERGPSGHALELLRHNQSSRLNSPVKYVLNRYVSTANHPRPESYREDVTIASDMYPFSKFSFAADISDQHKVHIQRNERMRNVYYNDIIAAAESGWDFSSRWLRDGLDLRKISTSSIIPVDLNAMMYRMERNLMEFHKILGNRMQEEKYRRAARDRAKAIHEILWSEKDSTWKDFDLVTNLHSSIPSISDYSPLWAKAFDPADTDRLERVVKSFKNSGLIKVGGAQTTTLFTGQQWDAPNAWPPAQDIVIEGLLNVNSAEAHELARELAKAWIRTSHTAWKQTGLMYEKYNSTELGGLGAGGEYFTQFGFGWTNGVILKYLTVHHNLLED
uniref:Trehalase n=1 Tax=Albugo laibachii Nc14 TaxID=890382 RepID=F0W9A6_9STRA|nr:trehalase putative [Albugo laibachii Nc14]CCA18365.1 trehalase putative [Albugo laibachii Nc14]|eukprot:CCA18365.1 trehalase putative [Albugo laibachii Nc14]